MSTLHPAHGIDLDSHRRSSSVLPRVYGQFGLKSPGGTVGRWRPSIPPRCTPRSKAERKRLLAEARRGDPGTGQMTYGSQAAAAIEVFEQQRDLALRDRAAQQLELVDSALARLADGSFGTCVRCGEAINSGAPRGAAVDRALHRLPRRCRQGAAVIGQDLVGLPAIEAATALLEGVVLRTPLVPYGSAGRARVPQAGEPPG